MFAMTLAGHHRHHHHHQTYGTKNVICKSPHKTPCGHIAKQKMKTCDRKKLSSSELGRLSSPSSWSSSSSNNEYAIELMMWTAATSRQVFSTISLQIDIEEAGHDTAVAADEQENDDGNS